MAQALVLALHGVLLPINAPAHSILLPLHVHIPLNIPPHALLIPDTIRQSSIPSESFEPIKRFFPWIFYSP